MAQKTLIAIAQQVATELNIPQPSAVYTSQDQNMLKILGFTRAVCDDLLAEFDWQVLKSRYSFSTVSGQEAYTFPTDIKRFLSGTFYDANNRWQMAGPKTPTEWEWLKAGNFTSGPYTQFAVFGNTVKLFPLPGSTTYTFNFEYLSAYYVKDGNSGLPKADFTQDADICIFDHRLVIYGIKLKFKASIAQDTTTALADYTRALEFAKGQDEPSPKLNLLGATGFRMLSNANIPDVNWG